MGLFSKKMQKQIKKYKIIKSKQNERQETIVDGFKKFITPDEVYDLKSTIENFGDANACKSFTEFFVKFSDGDLCVEDVDFYSKMHWIYADKIPENIKARED